MRDTHAPGCQKHLLFMHPTNDETGLQLPTRGPQLSIAEPFVEKGDLWVVESQANPYKKVLSHLTRKQGHILVVPVVVGLYRRRRIGPCYGHAWCGSDRSELAVVCLLVPAEPRHRVDAAALRLLTHDVRRPTSVSVLFPSR